MRRRWRRIALPLGAVALSLAGPERTAVPFQSPALGSDAHTYSFDLKPGWLLHLSLEQQGIDVLARVLAPDGRELFRVDSPNGGEGSEEVWLVARSAGRHQVAVEPCGKRRGRYRARLRALRPASDEDRVNALAERDYQLAFQREEKASRPWLEGMYLRAARAWESIGRTEREADARYRLGQIRSLKGDWRGALKAQRRARDLYHLVGDRRSEMLSLDRMAEAYQFLGEMAEARRILQETLVRWTMLQETWNVVATSYRICQLAHLGGRAWEALQCYERVLESWRTLRSRNEQAMVQVDIGTLYTSLGDLDRGLKSYREALALLPTGSAERGTALTQIGKAYLRAGLPRWALRRFKEALALSRTPGGEASALNGMGLAWQRIGEPARAIPLFARALPLLDTPAGKATVWSNIGRLHLSLRQPRSAVDAFERALSAGAGDRASRAEALSGLARAARLQGDWVTARRRMEEALEVIESLRSDVGQSDSSFLLDLLKATWLASKQDDYAFLIDLLMERHRLEPDRGYDRLALDVNERALARSLADSLGTASQPWSSLLDSDTALLEYSLGEERSFLWWVTRTGYASFELPGRAVLEAAARRLHGLVSCRRASQTAVRRRSLEVAELLLGPVAQRLSHDRLVIVAPDVLQYVPFETLLIDRHEVVRNPSATVLARLRARSGIRDQPREQPRGWLALLGHGVFSALDDRLPSDTRTSAEERGPRRLPYVDDEVRSVLSSAGGRKALAFTGFDAVPETVLGGALGGFRLLHLLGHGRTDPKRPERSGLLLSSFDRRGRPRPGWLTAKQVREIDLKADVVVLSACRTGLGREIRGEGLFGLSHSFLAAGASSVVVSLWNVDDRATAALMDRFYHELLVHGRPTAEALRLAQLSLRSVPRWRAPYYWGGFVIQGDGLNKARPGGSP